MKRTAQTFFFVVLFASTVFGATQRYIVATRTATELPRAAAMIRDIESPPTGQPVARRIRTFHLVNAFAANLDESEVAKLRAADNVSYVAPVVERHALEIGAGTASQSDTPNPFAQVVPYGIDLVRAREVWPVTRGEGINVVIVDTGIDYTHPELAAVYQGGMNELTGSNDPKDDNGHGTHVAGTIAAADNNVGVVGVAPHVKLWSVKVLDSSGNGTNDSVIAALDWIAQQKKTLGGDWVVNLSLGSATADPTERAAFTKAVQNGLLICAASGNDSTVDLPAPVGYPAAYAGVVAIGAIDSTKAIAVFSNQGPQLGVVAPGVAVLSSFPVGTGVLGNVRTSAGSYTAAQLQYSARGSVTAPFVKCGIGNPSDFPEAVKGKIAVIQRGTLTFSAKVHNAVAAGAVGVVIYNKDDTTDFVSWGLGSSTDSATTQSWPIAIGMSYADAMNMLANSSGEMTITNDNADYEFLSGTSMATPHAVGVAALVWSVAPQLAASDIIQALEQNADDLGASGFDTVFGSGLIDALTAAKALAPSRFGNPSTTPPPTSSKTHAVRHH
ncbi:MAG TPA: S8 family serine peptidase [Thermoanaerobaculia bacterium]|nr:S8 family serine peptidase [Thermoanaerobaculia bacterium]